MSRFVLIVVVIVISPFVYAEAAARELGWEDLVPASASFEDPFRLLSPVQNSDLALIADCRKRKENGEQLPDIEHKQMIDATQYLAGKGIDVEDLLARRDEVIALRIQARNALSTGLDGETVRIPGFLLPLEFDGTKVTEFFLVPYFGACIHVPPPPLNQMVHVKYAAGYEQPVLFQSVWVEGEMHVGQAEHELYLADGSGDVSVGYSIVAKNVATHNSE